MKLIKCLTVAAVLSITARANAEDILREQCDDECSQTWNVHDDFDDCDEECVQDERSGCVDNDSDGTPLTLSCESVNDDCDDGNRNSETYCHPEPFDFAQGKLREGSRDSSAYGLRMTSLPSPISG